MRSMCRFTWAFLLSVALFQTPSNLSARQFEKAVYYSAGQRPYHVITAHFTHSGNLDLAVTDYLSDRVCILLGQGNGVFKKSSCLSAFSLPVGIAVGDFNEDGNEDLAIVETGGTGHGDLKILLGDGKGRFHLSARYQTGIASGGLAVADFDGDGHLDAAITDFGFENTPGDVMVFFGDAHGKLGKPTKYLKGTTAPCGIVAGDLNGDHLPDLAITEFATGSVAILLNDGTGHFQKSASYDAAGRGAVDVKIADLRNNGRQDLVIANLSQGMVVLLNKGDGTFGKPTIYQPTFFNWQPPEACTVADFNIDGKLDVACAPNLYDAYFFRGLGNGNFGHGIEIKNTIQNQGGFSIAASDFSGDQAPDLAIPIQNYGKIAILLNSK